MLRPPGGVRRSGLYVLRPRGTGEDTDGLPEAAACAAGEFISGPLAREPHRVGTPLLAPFEAQWRGRRGEYRVRYEIDEASHAVRGLDVDHRRDGYRT